MNWVSRIPRPPGQLHLHRRRQRVGLGGGRVGGGERRRLRRQRHEGHVHQPGERRQRAGDFIEDVGPDIPVAIDLLNGPDLREDRVPHQLFPVLLLQEVLEAAVLGPGLDQARFELPRRVPVRTKV